MAKRLVGGVLLLALCWVGCRKPPIPLPSTYPVHGKVTYPDGKPVTAGSVTFIPAANPSISSVSGIAKDGTYRLNTRRKGLHSEGGVPGPNRVIVRASVTSVKEYSAPYTVKPGDNEINLTFTGTPASQSQFVPVIPGLPGRPPR